MNNVELEKIMKCMSIPESYAHTLSQLYVIIEEEYEVINSLRESQDLNSLFVFIKNEYETKYGEEFKLPKSYLGKIL